MIPAALIAKDLVEVRERVSANRATATEAEAATLDEVDGLLLRAIKAFVVAHPTSEQVLVDSGIPSDWAAMAADHR